MECYFLVKYLCLAITDRCEEGDFMLRFLWIITVLNAVILSSSVAALAGPDLSSVEALVQSDDYQVWVDGAEQFVFKSLKNTNHGTNNINSMSFLSFTLDEAKTVKIKPGMNIKTFEIRPYVAAMIGEPNERDNSISLVIERPQKLIVTVNNSYDRVLIISAEAPSIPPSVDSVEHYFGPGIHHPGRVDLKSNDDVYLADGAIVEGCFNIVGSKDRPVENVTITGRGILSLGEWPHKEAFRVFRGDDTKNVLIEGITVVNAPGWVISFWGESFNRNLTVRNVKMLGNFRYNTDIVQTGTDGLTVEDCLFQSNDDTFSLNGTCRNVVIRNNIFWNIYNGGVFMLGWATNGYDWSNINIHDNVIFRAGGCCDYDPKGPFSMKTYTRGKASGITFKNIIIEDIAPYGNWIDFNMKQKGSIKGLVFDNIDILSAWQIGGKISGFSPESPINDITFRDIRILGKSVESPEQCGLQLVNTEAVRFENTGIATTLTVGRSAPMMEAEPTQSSKSAAIEPEAAGANILLNPSFENGIKHWSATRSQCSIEVVESGGREDSSAMMVSGPQSGATGMHQDITEQLRQSGPGRYTYAAYVRTKSGEIPVHLGLKIVDGDGTHYHPSPDVEAGADSWSRIQRTHDLIWNGLEEAYIYIETAWGKSGTFIIDDCTLMR